MGVAMKPKNKKSNVRLIVFLSLVVLLCLVGIVYPMVDYQIHHGLKHRDGYDEVDLKSLGYFTFDPSGTIDQVPPRWRALDGKRVQLEGYPTSLQQSGPMTHSAGQGDLQFVYNVQICCFNGPPQVQERVFINNPKRLAITDEFTRLTGILHVKVEKDQGVATSVYTLDVENAELIR